MGSASASRRPARNPRFIVSHCGKWRSEANVTFGKAVLAMAIRGGRTLTNDRFPLSRRAQALRIVHNGLGFGELACLGYLWFCAITRRRGRAGFPGKQPYVHRDCHAPLAARTVHEDKTSCQDRELQRGVTGNAWLNSAFIASQNAGRE
jgi:hypothetical protein